MNKPKQNRKPANKKYSPKKQEHAGARPAPKGKKEAKPAAKGDQQNNTSGDTRLNKYIAHAGICSRREADNLITAGLVSVNGKVISELGTKVQPGDDVRYNGERLGNEKKVYLLLNKPKDYVSTLDDAHAKKTVMDLISKAGKERIYPVGRLDKNTTGVLLFTNDGDLTKKLTHPSFNKKKIYHVHLNKNMIHSDLKKISEGLELEDGPVRVDAIAYASPDNKKEIGVEIHSGKNRIVRRIFESLDYRVTKLDRVYFAGLTKKNLPRGRWRFLTDKEIKMLKMNAFE
jgi:23S rRNA pseudouridine2605 synthase